MPDLTPGDTASAASSSGPTWPATLGKALGAALLAGLASTLGSAFTTPDKAELAKAVSAAVSEANKPVLDTLATHGRALERLTEGQAAQDGRLRGLEGAGRQATSRPLELHATPARGTP